MIYKAKKTQGGKSKAFTKWKMVCRKILIPAFWKRRNYDDNKKSNNC